RDTLHLVQSPIVHKRMACVGSTRPHCHPHLVTQCIRHHAFSFAAVLCPNQCDNFAHESFSWNCVSVPHLSPVLMSAFWRTEHQGVSSTISFTFGSICR